MTYLAKQDVSLTENWLDQLATTHNDQQSIWGTRWLSVVESYFITLSIISTFLLTKMSDHRAIIAQPFISLNVDIKFIAHDAFLE